MDLEHVLPAGVQVTSIDPATSKTGEVNIRLRVSGERDRAVELMRNLREVATFCCSATRGRGSAGARGSRRGGSGALCERG